MVGRSVYVDPHVIEVRNTSRHTPSRALPCDGCVIHSRKAIKWVDGLREASGWDR